MHRTLNFHADVPPDRTVTITLPGDVPVGPADLIVSISTNGTHTVRTFGDLLKSDLFGAWAHRDDIGDSVEFARRIREEAWRRGT